MLRTSSKRVLLASIRNLRTQIAIKPADMMQYTLFAYFRLKILATLLRVVVRFASASALHRDRVLSAKIDVRHDRIKIASRDKGRYLEADVYSSPNHLNAKTPVLVNWHGSGFMFPLLGSDALYCSQIVRDTGITVIDADYRKGPETTFPGPLNDAIDTLKWVAAQDQFDVTRIGLSGFSAGGTIALAAASSSKEDRLEFEISTAIAMYPVTDLSIAPEAKTVPNPKRPHPHFMQHLFNECYAPDLDSRKHPRVSPSAADPAHFPATVLILTCDGDIFEPEASELAQKLDDGKRRVIHRIMKDVHHGFDKGCGEGTSDWDRRNEAYALVVKVLQQTIMS
jgi:acetyl esterase/lipase